MEVVALFAALLLPWALGIAALIAVRDASTRIDAAGELAWSAGAGYPVGAVLLTLWMRVLAFAGVSFSMFAIALPLLAVLAALAYTGWRRHGSARLHVVQALRTPAEIGGKARILWWILVALIAAHLALVGYEVALRPLYPWEAWIAWATKARVWFDQRTIVPFVNAGEWLAPGANAWFDASPRNPATLPLLQVYACLALGRWDDALMNWPWWQFAVALTLALYGGLRRLGLGALAALIASYLGASLPFANVHVALAGYAEFPLAVCYTIGVLAYVRWTCRWTWGDALAAAFFVAAGVLVKVAGLFCALTLLPGIVAATMPRRGGRFLAAAFGVVLLALTIFAQTNFVLGGRALHIEFAPAWPQLAESLFIAGNWNVLWYGLIGVVALSWRQLALPAMFPLTTILATGLLFVAILFAFPGLGAAIIDPLTVDRALLLLAPTAIVFMALAFQAFAAHWRATHEPPVAAAEAATPAPTV